jgi:hypothetical protein
MEHVAQAFRQQAARVDVVLSNPGWQMLADMEQVGTWFASGGANLITGAPGDFYAAVISTMI